MLGSKKEIGAVEFLISRTDSQYFLFIASKQTYSYLSLLPGVRGIYLRKTGSSPSSLPPVDLSCAIRDSYKLIFA